METTARKTGQTRVIRRMGLSFRRLVLPLLVLGATASCRSGGSSHEADGPIPVVATIFPVADWVRNVAGDRASVTVLLPPGASPHTFDPKPSRIREISRARVFFQIGAGLELWAGRVVQAAGNRRMEVVRLADGMDLLCSGDDDHCTDNPGDPDHAANPHVWLDPQYAEKMVKRIEEVLSGVDPAGADAYRRNADAYVMQLRSLDADIRETVAAFAVKKYVAFHPAWAYFSKRYGLEPVGIIEESPGKEATPAHLERIVSAVREYGIPAVFAEFQLNPKAAEVIARETGARVAFLDPLGGEGLKGRDSYLALMRYNLREMEKVLGAGSGVLRR